MIACRVFVLNLLFLSILLAGCFPNHRQKWASQVDSLRAENNNLTKSIQNSALREGLNTIKIESGSRLILLDRYQEVLIIDSTVAPILRYAVIHKEAQSLDDHLDFLAKTLLERSNALKNLRTDIESGAWKKDSIFGFIDREKNLEKNLHAKVEKALEKAIDLNIDFKALHPKIVHYTDSLLQIRM